MDKCIVNIAGYNYDLSPLQKSSGNMVSGRGDYDYYFNFCDEILFQSTKYSTIRQQCGDSSAVMISKDKSTCYPVGIDMSMSANFFLPLTDTMGSPESGIALTMDAGECDRKILIRLDCEPNYAPPREIGWPPYDIRNTQGNLQIAWNTPHGCPISKDIDSYNESTKSIGSPDEPVNIPNTTQDRLPEHINHNKTMNVTDGSCNIIYSIDEVICYGVRLYRSGFSGSKLIESFDNTICIFIFWLIVTNKRLHIVNNEREFAKDIIKWLIQLRMMSWLIVTYPH